MFTLYIYEDGFRYDQGDFACPTEALDMALSMWPEGDPVRWMIDYKGKPFATIVPIHSGAMVIWPDGTHKKWTNLHYEERSGNTVTVGEDENGHKFVWCDAGKIISFS